MSLNYFTGLPAPNAIPNPSIAVLFKSLMKSSAVTKEKSLSELLASLTAETADEITLVSWMQLYPKLAIDNTRTIRILSHQIQGKMLELWGKAFAKHLKTSIATWVHGLYDSDRTVAQAVYKTFLAAFQTREKIDRIWTVYRDQLVDFCTQAILHESPESLSDKRYTKEEDAQAKYERVVAGCVQMVTKMAPDSIDDLTPILASENLWEHLASASNSETMNLALFRALLGLVRAILAQNVGKTVYKLVSKKFLKTVRLKGTSKSANPGLVYSSVVVPLWDTLTALTAHEAKKNFWEYGGEKAHARFLEYLRLGYCNSSPEYYTSLGLFFREVQKREDDSPLSFSLEKHAREVETEFCKQLRSLNSTAEKKACVECACAVSAMFVHGDLSEIVYTAVEVFAVRKEVPVIEGVPASVFEKMNKAFIEEIKDKEEKDGQDTTLSTKKLFAIVPTWMGLLAQYNLSSEFVARVISTIEEDSSIEEPRLAFAIVSAYLATGSADYTVLGDFAETLPSYISAGFVDPVVDVFAAYTKAGVRDMSQAIEDVYVQLEAVSPEKVDSFLSTVHVDLDKAPEVREYLVRAAGEQKTDLCYRFKEDPQIAAALRENAHTEAQKLRYIQECGEGNDDPVLTTTAWAHSEDPACRTFLSGLSEKSRVHTFVSYLDGCGKETNMDSAVAFAAEMGIVGDVIDALKVTQICDDDIGVVESNYYLWCENNHGENMAISSVHSYGRFLLLSNHTSIPAYLLAAAVCSHLEDAVFLGQDAAYLDLSSSLKTWLLGVRVSYDDLVEVVDKGEVEGSLIYALASHNHYRALVFILSKVFDTATPAQISSPLNLTRLSKQPVLLGAILQAAGDHVTSPAFERIRSFIAAEILGHKLPTGSPICGLVWLTIFSNVFVGHYDVVPPHRLAMVVNQVASWMDIDAAYDVTFIEVRVQVARWLCGLLNTVPSPPDKAYALAAQVAGDNLGYCAVEADRRDLRHVTLRLVSALARSPVWSEYGDGVATELVDLVVDEQVRKYDSQCTSHAVGLTNELMERVFRQVSPKIELLQNKEVELFNMVGLKEALQAEDTEIHPSSISRTAVASLLQVVTSTQKSFVVDYHFLPADERQARLPIKLYANVNIVPPPIDDSRALTYLWSWLLVMRHFDDIALGMRNDYVAQLNEHGALDVVLGWIFDSVHVGDPKVLAKLTVSGKVEPEDSADNLVPTYDIFAPGDDERTLLALHMYYLLCLHVGPTVQRWYKTLRDVQLKQQIERFTRRFVSPLLVARLLADVTEKKHKLEAADDTFSIKVNSVTNEIKSTYVIDEQTMEMVIKVPFVFPLDMVLVEGPLRLGVKEHQWKAWLLASQRVISLTNGSIMDAIEVFNRNVSLHFSGFEDCAICYSILHQDMSLPSKVCPTCSNKFHAACLYKWFKSSGSSTCPLCRSVFNFR